MEKQLETRLYDRLAELTMNDGGRLMAHLEGADNAERQARFTDRMKAEGFQRVPIWVHRDELVALRERYPGPRGGVDWQAVVIASLRQGQDHV